MSDPELTSQLTGSDGRSSAATMSEATERIVGFSDALFAIALTFLALELADVPAELTDASSAELTDYLRERLPDYSVYFGVFILVAFLWYRHHEMFRFIKQRSAVLMWVNWVLLALVALLPYPAAVVSRSMGFGSAMTYLLGSITVIAFLLLAEWVLADRRQLLLPDTPQPLRTRFRVHLLGTLLILVVATGIAIGSWATDSSPLCYLAAGVAALVALFPLLMRLVWPYPAGVVVQESAKQAQDPDSGPKADELRERILVRLVNGSDPARLKMIADGVIAIAVTIMALQLHPPGEPEPSNAAIVHSVLNAPWWTYLTTFLLIGVFWTAHVRLTDRMLAVDPMVLWLNLVFLMLVAFLPVPQALLRSTHGATPIVLYLTTMTLIAACLSGMSIYGREIRHLVLPKDPKVERFNTVQAITLIAIFVITIIVVLITQQPVYSNLVWILLLVRNLVIGRIFRVEQRDLD